MTQDAPGGRAALVGGPVAGGRDRIRAVLFDVDDTLVDTAGAFRHALAAIGTVYWRDLGPLSEDLVDAALRRWRADVGGHYRAYTRGECPYLVQRWARARDLQSALGARELAAGEQPAWDEVFDRAFAEGWSAHADAAVCLGALRVAGVRVGAVSNATRALQEEKLRRVGLAEVPMLVGVDTFGRGKPDPRVFLEGCRLLGVEPGEAVYIGDELDIDAQAAASAGLLGVWLDRSGAGAGGGDGVPRITSLDQLPSLVLTSPVRGAGTG